MIALVIALGHAAEPVFNDRGIVLAAPNIGPYAGGISAPTVVFDGKGYVMYFETPRAATTPDCADGFAIGRATSNNGRNWVLDAAEILGPAIDPDAMDRCGVSQPAVVFDGKVFHLFYSQSRTKRTSTATANRNGGIGYATSENGVDFSRVDDAVVPPASTAVGLASALILDGQFYLYYSQYPDLYVASGPIDLSTEWSLDGLVMDHDDQDWSATWLLSAAALCRQGGEVEIFVGGNSGAVRSIGRATSPDAYEFEFASDDPLTSPTLDIKNLKHWDVIAGKAVGQYMMWYAKDDLTGRKVIGMASTDRFGRPLSRVCSL